MAENVTIKIAVQGNEVKTEDIPIGSTLAEVKVIKNLPELEYRIKGEPIDDDYEFVLDDNGIYLVGTRDSKGGIS